MNRSETAKRALCSAAIVLAADQLTKSAVSRLGDQHPAWLLPVRNRGLGLELVTVDRWIEVCLMAAGLAAAVWLLIRAAERGRAPIYAVALVLGGAAGNLMDRLLLGSVRDFLPVAHLVVINLADVAIIAGVAAIAITRHATRRPLRSHS